MQYDIIMNLMLQDIGLQKYYTSDTQSYAIPVTGNGFTYRLEVYCYISVYFKTLIVFYFGKKKR